MARIARATGTTNAATGMFDLIKRLKAPTALGDIGMKHADLPRAASLAMSEPYYNPRPVTHEGIAKLLDDAFVGRRPVL
jgi:maleylacetate reductase